jgi:protein SCO1/2
LIRLPALFFGLAVVLALGAAALTWRSAATDAVSDGQGNAAIGGSFTLTDQDGHTRTDRDFRGRWMIVYFGYTFCPDVCPTTLQTLADSLRRLGPRAQRIVPVLITLDPARDRPSVLKKYLAAFGYPFVGLTGTKGEIASVAKAYRIYYAQRPLPGGGYSVDHANTIYLMGPDGRFVSLLDDQQNAAALSKDIASHL